MDDRRRQTVKALGGMGILGLLAAQGLLPTALAETAWAQDVIGARTLADVYTALGTGQAALDDQVGFDAPDVSENGLIVPLTVRSALPGTERIVVMVENNLNVVAGDFLLPTGTLAEVELRAKVTQTSDLYALVKAVSGFYVVRRHIRVVRGACHA